MKGGIKYWVDNFCCIKDVPFFPDYEISYVFTQKEKKYLKKNMNIMCQYLDCSPEDISIEIYTQKESYYNAIRKPFFSL